jgi:hypothetical protein
MSNPRRNVVHLTRDAHQQAVEFCRRKGLFIGDWVGLLIQVAIAQESGFAGWTESDFTGGEQDAATRPGAGVG